MDTGGTLGPFLRPTIPLDHGIDDGDQVLISQLEVKRKQLEQQIHDFIASKQLALDEFQNSIMSRTATETAENSLGCQNEDQVDVKSERAVNGGEHLERPRHADYRFPPVLRGDMSPRDRESELSGVFMPDFLPLLDSNPDARRNSAPTAPTLPQDTKTNETQVDLQLHHQRAATDSVLTKEQPARKSALKTKKSTRQSKRVSISIDDAIVRPSDEPKHIVAKPLEYDDVSSDSPNVAITDRDGALLYVWVPDDARHPYPEEDAMDYLASVRGVLHYTDDSHAATGPLQRFPSESYLDSASAITVQDETIPVDPELLEPITGSLDMPVPESFTPPTSPPLQIRHAPSYIDHFGASSGQIQSPPSSKISPKADDMEWELFGAGEGPLTSYVGGIDGSGVDHIDAGSVGYPSSVGASYMEQFAAQRLATSHSGKVPTDSDTFDFALADDLDEKPLQIVKDARPQIKAAENDQFLGEMEF